MRAFMSTGANRRTRETDPGRDSISAAFWSDEAYCEARTILTETEPQAERVRWFDGRVVADVTGYRTLEQMRDGNTALAMADALRAFVEE